MPVPGLASALSDRVPFGTLICSNAPLPAVMTGAVIDRSPELRSCPVPWPTTPLAAVIMVCAAPLIVGAPAPTLTCLGLKLSVPAPGVAVAADAAPVPASVMVAASKSALAADAPRFSEGVDRFSELIEAAPGLAAPAAARPPSCSGALTSIDCKPVRLMAPALCSEASVAALICIVSVGIACPSNPSPVEASDQLAPGPFRVPASVTAPGASMAMAPNDASVDPASSVMVAGLEPPLVLCTKGSS